MYVKSDGPILTGCDIDDNLNPYMRIFLSDPEGMALIVPDYNSQGRLLEFYLHTKDVNVQPH